MANTSPAAPVPAPGFAMPLADAMRTQRAIRRLKPDPVDDALVLELIELALWAPTGSNAQNWEFVVVKDRAVKERLGRLNRQAWRLYGGLGRRMSRNDPKMLRILDAVQWQADHFADIPVIVVACLRGPRIPFPPIAAASFYGSIFPAVQNLLLAAHAVGLGTTLTTLHRGFEDELKGLLGIPAEVEAVAVVPLGYTLDRPGPTRRKPVAEVAFRDRWGRPFVPGS
jgi:nitroreductase